MFKGDKIVVPSSLRSDYLRQIHQGHPGIEATKNRVRDLFCWLSLSSEVENLVNQYSVCNMYKRHQQKEYLGSHDVAVRPWSILTSDLFTWNGIDYLITVDWYSGWFEHNSLNSGMTSKEVIPKLKADFSRFDVSDELNTDNGPQYLSSEFMKL